MTCIAIQLVSFMAGSLQARNIPCGKIVITWCPEMGLNRARGFNNKGILNEYRKPKAAYHAVKTLYKRFAKEE